LKHSEIRNDNNNTIIIDLHKQISKLEEYNRELESEKELNRNDYESLTLEVEDFTTGLEHLQNQNSKLESILKQKELKCEELEYKISTLQHNKSEEIEMQKQAQSSSNQQNQINKPNSMLFTAINKLTVKMYEFLKGKKGNQANDESESKLNVLKNRCGYASRPNIGSRG